MRVLVVLFMVVLAACCSTTFVVDAQKCMAVINNPDSHVPYIPLTPGQYHVCVGTGDSNNPTLQFCSTDLYDIPPLISKPGSKVKVPGKMPKSKYLNCVRGTAIGKKAWLTTFRGANVIVTKEAQHLTHSWKASDFPAKVDCDGFYTALVLNPKTPDDRIRAMFNQLSNCHMKEGVEDKAKDRVISAVGMASDLVALIPTVGTAASLVIKACVFAENLKIDMTEDDRIKFLAIHMTIAKLDVMCGTGASGKKLQKCLADAKAQAKLKGGKGKYKISFEACNDGLPGTSDYLELYSDGHKVVTTSGGNMVTSSPLYKLCSDGASFHYFDMNFDPNKKFCIKCLARNTVFANTEHGEVCHSNIVAGQQSFNVRCAKTIKLTFTTQPQ